MKKIILILTILLTSFIFGVEEEEEGEATGSVILKNGKRLNRVMFTQKKGKVEVFYECNQKKEVYSEEDVLEFEYHGLKWKWSYPYK